ncbi:hypothetical protein J437_LFUL008748 [Ladona fulva]|uniref:Sodium channel modifier 1 zinc-finger domain-containing protein n=1 Tax=Ladona fulva TaxID=123851 RepID=A0A8K0K560_LADFU|nr:hypothetical protein J437_LFUL008748 [Ladona fulva]
MSFKRDSTDTSLLRNLKFRRVSEILAQQIPEDEARLLSNGRLTCLVCLHRPIFDNVNMLSIHRKGRRHIAGKINFVFDIYRNCRFIDHHLIIYYRTK